jgi:hypothetical protein
MILSGAPVASFSGTEVERAARSILPVYPAAEPFFDCGSGRAVVLATYVGEQLGCVLA